MNSNKNTEPTLEAQTERLLARSQAHSSRFLRIQVTAPSSSPKSTRPPIRIAFVLDRSGSMDGDKLTVAKSAIVKGINRLGADDSCAVVTFDDHVDTVLPLTVARAATSKISQILSEVEARNQTNLCDGYLTGAQEVGADTDATVNNRIILVSDGYANVGETSPVALAQHASELRRRGVTTATLGIGEEFEEKVMSAIATGGGGPAHFASTPAEIPEAIAGCIQEALDVTLRSARISIELPGADFQVLSAGDVQGARGECHVDLGDLAADQMREVVVRVRLPKGADGTEARATVRLAGRTDQGPVSAKAAAAWTYAGNLANDAQPRNVEVDRVVAAHFAAIARERATALNREGEFQRAREELEKIARRIESYANGDAELKELVASLRIDAREWSRQRSELDRKEQYYLGFRYRMSRSADGSLRRGR